MAQVSGVRTVFLRSQLTEIPQAAAIAQHASATSAEAAIPQCGADAPAPPAPLPDKPASVEEALDMMRGYVGRLAGAFSRGRDYGDDLFQVGQFAVARAFETFRGDEGISFVGYAWKNARWKIMAELRREIYETRHVASGDAPLAQDSEFTLFDVLVPRQASPETSGRRQLNAQLHKAASKLRGRQRMFVELLLRGRSQTEIAALLGVSHQRVQQVVALALVNLRKRMTHGFIIERIPQREERIALAVRAACAGPADLPEESSGSLRSTWPSFAERVPGFDYGSRRWRPATPGESADDGQAAGVREETPG